MKKFNFSHLVAIALTAMTLCLVGCDQPKDATLSSLEGKWKSAYGEVYTITADTFVSENTYAGNELTIVEDDANSGRIFVKYTMVPDWSKGQATEPVDKTGWVNSYGSWYPSNSELLGKWYAIHYEGLTESSVKLSGAYGAKSATDTLDDAKSEFTVANGYFAMHSECTKVTE